MAKGRPGRAQDRGGAACGRGRCAGRRTRHWVGAGRRSTLPGTLSRATVHADEPDCRNGCRPRGPTGDEARHPCLRHVARGGGDSRASSSAGCAVSALKCSGNDPPANAPRLRARCTPRMPSPRSACDHQRGPQARGTDSPDAEPRLPQMAAMQINRVLVVTAHPDDVDFGVAGTVANWTDAGVEVAYCIVTDGDAGGFDPLVPAATSPVSAGPNRPPPPKNWASTRCASSGTRTAASRWRSTYAATSAARSAASSPTWWSRSHRFATFAASTAATPTIWPPARRPSARSTRMPASRSASPSSSTKVLSRTRSGRCG